LLFTNNGNLANKLMHPSSEIDREYAVRVLGKVEQEDLRQLTDGIGGCILFKIKVTLN
jgi:23S rRNA pseudouridine2605 synthase